MKSSAGCIKAAYQHLANFFFYPLLAFSILLSTTSSALEKEDAAKLLKGLHHSQIQSFFAINAFYNFSANDGDKVLLSDINEAINEVNSSLNAIEQVSTEGEIKQALDSGVASWQEYKTTLNTIINDILDQGYADLRLMADLAKMNQDFTDSLSATYIKVESDSGYKPESITSKSRSASVLMAVLMTKYSARTTSSVSQMFQGAETGKTIDVLAGDLDKQLISLQKISTGEQKQSIDSVITKWEFIKGSYINYNEKNVNYVVNLYSKRIIDTLESTANADGGA